jgi:hypothetical protein
VTGWLRRGGRFLSSFFMLGEEEKSKLAQKYGTEVFSCTSLK